MVQETTEESEGSAKFMLVSAIVHGTFVNNSALEELIDPVKCMALISHERASGLLFCQIYSLVKCYY